MRLGMKRPDVFSSLYPMSACCMLEGGEPSEALAAAEALKTREAVAALRYPNKSTLARAAAWSPNPKNPPDYYDLPVKDGKPQPLIIGKWYANMPLVMVDQYVPNLKKYRALAGDVGLQDTLLNTNRQLSDALTDSGVAYKFETYEGDHTNRIPERLETKVFPFFSENLIFQSRR